MKWNNEINRVCGVRREKGSDEESSKKSSRGFLRVVRREGRLKCLKGQKEKKKEKYI